MNNSDHLVGQIYAVPFGSQVKRSEVSDTLCHSAAQAKTESVNLSMSPQMGCLLYTKTVRAFSNLASRYKFR